MSASRATGLAITDPLVKYRTLLSSKAITRDPAQYRLALHLQKLYERLKDYEPQIEYSRRLDQISQAVGRGRRQDAVSSDVVERPTRRSSWRSLLAAKESRDSLALTRKLTSAENAMHIDSPKGLMLHGEVGTGKSMLIDLFADCLPNRKKRRWHFSTFMLETFAKLEALRRERGVTSAGVGDDDYSMLWLARDMIEKSPIVFLDEFQLPDRAASKIMTNLMTSFFHLGGVLVATSNRMPEELAKAAGIEFPPPPSKLESLGWQLGLRRRSVGASDRLFAGQNEFAGFLDVLKARCEVWEMEGSRDYRRLESGETAPKRREEEEEAVEWQVDGHEDLQHGAGMAGWPEANAEDGKEAGAPMLATPVNYVIDSSEDNGSRTSMLSKATGHQTLESIPWEPSVIKVYGRLIPVPRAWNGTTCWSFEELCKTTLGPADYITLASTYHTLILTDVPVLTWLMKNEARRFITSWTPSTSVAANS